MVMNVEQGSCSRIMFTVGVTGHFPYWSFCPRGISPTGHFAYWTIRLLDILPTAWTVHLQIAHFAYKTARIKSDV